MKVQIIRIKGYETRNAVPFTEDAVIMPKDLSDSMRDDVLRELRNNHYAIGFIFNEGDLIVGEHRFMTVTSYQLLEELEMVAVQ